MRSREHVRVVSAPSASSKSSESLVPSSQATRRVLVAAKNCALHFGNVVGMYRVFPFVAIVDPLDKNDAAVRSSMHEFALRLSLFLSLSLASIYLFSCLPLRGITEDFALCDNRARLLRFAKTLRGLETLLISYFIQFMAKKIK